MSVLFRCRVEPRQLKQASKIASGLGTSLQEAVRIFMAQIVRTGRVPVSLSIREPDDLLDVERRNKILSELDDEGPAPGTAHVRVEKRGGFSVGVLDRPIHEGELAEALANFP